MRVVLIITDYGSFNNFLGDLAVALSRENEVYVITSQDKVINIEDRYDYTLFGIEFFTIEFPRSFNFYKHYKVSRAIHKILDKIQPDVISIHFTTALFSTLLTGKPPFKTIGTFHGIGYPMIENKVKKQIFKRVEFFSIRKLDKVWLLNEYDYKLLKPIYNEKINLLPTKGVGCDLNVFDPKSFLKNDKNNLRKKLNISEKDFVFTYTGRYVDFKGFGLTVKAFKLLQEKYKIENIKLITMGGEDKIHPTGLTPEEKAYCKKNIAIIDIGFTREVAKHLAITDVFVFPSKKEGIPVCIIEALAMNVPVVTLNARGCNDLVEDEKNGCLVDIDSTAGDLAESLASFLGEKGQYKIKKMKHNILKYRNELSRKSFVNHQIKYFDSLK